jgi:hypothetical protein
MLSENQRRSFEDRGYLAFGSVFTFEEAGWLGDEALAMSLRLPHGSSHPAYFDLHLRSEPFRRLADNPRLLGLAQDLSAAPLRLSHTRLCPAREADGDAISRHDHGAWEPMAEPMKGRITAAVMLDVRHDDHPALYLTPGSHRRLAGDIGAETPIDVAVPFGSVVMLHDGVRYALARPDTPHARSLFLVSYAPEAGSLQEESPDHRLPTPYPARGDNSLWPLAFWVAG